MRALPPTPSSTLRRLRRPGLGLGVGLGVAAALVTITGGAEAQKRRKPKDDAVDISKVKPDLVVLTDDDGDFYVMSGTWTDEHHLYYGDGKTMHQLRVFGGGADGTTGRIGFSFWSPRADGNAEVERNDKGVWQLHCGSEKFTLTKATDTVAKKILDTAAFKKPFWRRQAHALARDDAGNYYYVDRMRDEWGGKAHRIFVGPKGGLKEQPMVNVVSDSVGEIYATRRGELRFVTSNDSATWIKGSSKRPLTRVPIEDNVRLIYGELGVYDGSLGTPCDDM